MDGPIRVGHRMLSIEFQSDRYVQDRIELAYRRLETLAIVEDQPEDSVQVALLEPFNMATFASEIQG